MVHSLTYNLKPLKPGENKEKDWRKYCTQEIDSANQKKNWKLETWSHTTLPSQMKQESRNKSCSTQTTHIDISSVKLLCLGAHAQWRHTVFCWCFLSVCLSVILSVTGIAAQRVQFNCWNMHKWVQSHVFSDLNWLDFWDKAWFCNAQLDLLTSKFCTSLLDVFNNNLAHSESFYNSRVSGIPRYN